ncbi:MAG: DUF2330 domain-containing protein [Deltaproteobacteria bacterium]|nr:DUF2330 domain-containing protein [Deltaproteobacteria bacterium]
MRNAATVFIVWITFLLPSTAVADGMAFRSVSSGGSLEVRATAQRAVMWRRSLVWEIHVQPVFDREVGASAWVIPFPVRPRVHESSADFFDQLELITSPVFLKYCSEDSGSGCVAAKNDGYGGGRSNGSQASVTIWERGEVGELDYVILSAEGGDDVAAWLADEGYSLPAGADAILAALDTEGVFFFAARLSADADPLKPLAPVRFVLPEMDPPAYPLRLTGLGAPEGEHLDLTLWVIIDQEQGFLPSSHPFGYLPVRPTDGIEFDAALDRFFEGNTARTVVCLASVRWELPTIMDGLQFCDDFMTCATFDDLGIEPPGEWTPELVEIRNASQSIYRYQGRFSADAMAGDLTLGPVPPSDLPWASNVYSEHLGDCDEIGPYSFCAMAGRPGIGWLALAAVLVAVGAVLLVRGRRR